MPGESADTARATGCLRAPWTASAAPRRPDTRPSPSPSTSAPARLLKRAEPALRALRQQREGRGRGRRAARGLGSSKFCAQKPVSRPQKALSSFPTAKAGRGRVLRARLPRSPRERPERLRLRRDTRTDGHPREGTGRAGARSVGSGARGRGGPHSRSVQRLLGGGGAGRRRRRRRLRLRRLRRLRLRRLRRQRLLLLEGLEGLEGLHQLIQGRHGGLPPHGDSRRSPRAGSRRRSAARQ